MTSFLIQRLVQIVPTLLGASLVIFFFMRVAPGDPATLFLDPGASPEARAAWRAEFGLDEPLAKQYLDFVVNAVQGDLGRSFRSGAEVTHDIVAALPGTIELTAFALFVSVVIGITLGVLAAVYRNTIVDFASMLIAIVGVSMPVFWLGLLLLMYFSVELRWLPVSGRINPRIIFDANSGFLFAEALLQGNLPAAKSAIRHLLLPGFTLGLAGAALIARMTRASVLEVLGRDYVRTAKSKGMRSGRVIVRHALRNALVPIVTTVGTQFGYLLSGAVLTETVFNWPGLGTLLVNAVFMRDYPVVQGVVLYITVMFVFVNLIVDVIYTFLDPRIRY